MNTDQKIPSLRLQRYAESQLRTLELKNGKLIYNIQISDRVKKLLGNGYVEFIAIRIAELQDMYFVSDIWRFSEDSRNRKFITDIIEPNSGSLSILSMVEICKAILDRMISEHTYLLPYEAKFLNDTYKLMIEVNFDKMTYSKVLSPDLSRF